MNMEQLQRRRLARHLLETRNELCNKASPFAPRSLQIDFASIDDEYRTDLVKNIINAFSILPQVDLSRFANELRMLLDMIVFYCTIWQNLPTPGQALLGLKYSNLQKGDLSEIQKLQYFTCSILTPYFVSKFSSYVYRDRPSEVSYIRKLRLLYRLLDGSHKCLSLTNFLTFLYNGKFRNISERLCEIVCYSVKRDVSRQEMEWDVINQELMWHEFSEALLFLMPFLGSHFTAEQFRFLKRSRVDQDKMEGKCPACLSTIINNPFACVPCGHLYCYYCIASRTTSTQIRKKFHCLKCNVKVEAIQRAE